MLISLLLVVVPTVLTLAILIPVINSRNKRVVDELGELRKQLEQLSDMSAPAAEKKRPEPECQIADVETDKEEKEDAEAPAETDTAASKYNTGKSGKIYTKEELELLIKE